MKKLILIASLIAGPALLLAQTAGQTTGRGYPLIPGDPNWTGVTMQINPAPAYGDKGGLEPLDIQKPLGDEWRTYSGDLSGKRFSSLKLANTATVKNLSLKWLNTTLTTGCGPMGTGAAGAGGGAAAAPAGGGGGGRGGGGGGGNAAAISVGGFGDGSVNSCGSLRFGGGVIVVGGMIYGASNNDVYGIDARDGTPIWHYYWKYRGGTSTGTRGVGMWHNYIYFEFHDDWVVCLDAKTGKEVWRHELSPFDQQYFSSMAPVVINDHILVGTGNDTDMPAFLKSLDPRTGALQWIHYSTAQNPGEPGLETWGSLEASRHGNGATWVPGSYDPETHLYIYGTGNPTPAYTQGRGEGDNLFTSCLLAVNVDTGKMAWYFQTSPHDTHDWDSTQTPVLTDAMFGGRMRKLVITATRNGYFFVNDRTTGEHLVTTRLGGATTNWAIGLDEKGQPKRNPYKDATVAGSIVNGSVLNYPPPTFSPDTGLFYINVGHGLGVRYLMDLDPRGSMGLGGGGGGGASFSWPTTINAIDYRTGLPKWEKEGSNVGMLSTAGGLLFTTNTPNVEAWDAATGTALWHAQIGGLSSPPETFMLDGKQHFLFNAGQGLFMFVLN